MDEERKMKAPFAIRDYFYPIVLLIIVASVVLSVVFYSLFPPEEEETNGIPIFNENGELIGYGLTHLGGSAEVNEICVTLMNGTETATANLTDLPIFCGNTSFKIDFVDNGDGILGGEDLFIASGSSTNCELKVSYIPSGGEIWHYTF